MEKIRNKNGTIRYRETIYIGNKKINSPCFTKITDAKNWKVRMENEKFSKLALGENFISNHNINFKEYALKWLEDHVQTNCVPKTYQAYKSIIHTHLLPRFAKLGLCDLNENHGVLLMNELKKTHNPKGVLNIWGVMKGILVKARKDKIIKYDPFENIQRPRLNLREDSYWVKDEINQFLRFNSKDQLYPLYFVAIHTGMRLAELCGLCWDRVDFKLNLISVTRTRDKYGLKDTTKTKLKRVIPMTPEVRSLLLSLFNKQLNGKFVFIENDNSEVKYAHIYRRFKQAQKKAVIQNLIRFHDLRHSFASNYMMNGGNVFDLQKLLGHTDIKMTMRYAHFTPDHLQNSIQFMSMFKEENESNIPVTSQQESRVVENLIMLGS